MRMRYLPATFAENCRTSARSEEHTSELQSRGHLVCRLLLEKKKKQQQDTNTQSNRHTKIETNRQQMSHATHERVQDNVSHQDILVPPHMHENDPDCYSTTTR